MIKCEIGIPKEIKHNIKLKVIKHNIKLKVGGQVNIVQIIFNTQLWKIKKEAFNEEKKR